MNNPEVRMLISDLYHSLGSSVLGEIPDAGNACAGLRAYDEPLVGFASADDPLFATYKSPGVIGPWHMSPKEWLPDAKTVISVFFPSSEEVRNANARENAFASMAWNCAHYGGQAFIGRCMSALSDHLTESGYSACIPQQDPRWRIIRMGEGVDGFPEMTPGTFGSKWSERHAAYACGLGTFGLSKGLITERGMAGRFGSVVTSLELEPDARAYTGIYDYCTHCGECVKRCPAGAIDPVKGKDHVTCHLYLEHSKEQRKPLGGCGLCQTGVPCECRNPSAAHPC